MPRLHLDETERAALVALLTAEVQNTRWPLAPCTKALRSILEKLEPAKPRAEPLPPPKPIGEPSHMLARKKRGKRR